MGNFVYDKEKDTATNAIDIDMMMFTSLRLHNISHASGVRENVLK